jgi:hypothetical protein
MSFLRRISFNVCPNENEEARLARVKSSPDSTGWELYDRREPVHKEEFCDLHKVEDVYDAVYITPTNGWLNVRTWDKFFVEHLAFRELPAQVLTSW